MSKKQTLSKKPQQRTGIAFLTAALTLSFCTVATATADSAAETEIRAISICSENGCTMLDFSPTREAPKMEYFITTILNIHQNGHDYVTHNYEDIHNNLLHVHHNDVHNIHNT